VLSQAARFALAGAGLGLLLALGLSAIFARALYLINAFDPFGYLLGTAVVLLACGGATFVPSRRATRISPITALRTD
jgi:putative ABC transport system permease protein